MSRCHPPEPQFAIASEGEVWRRLTEALPMEAVLVANLRITDEDKDHEADIVVVLPDVGCVVLEVKGGSVWVSGGGVSTSSTNDRRSSNVGGSTNDGHEWWLRAGGAERRIHPVDQARDSKHALRRYVENDPRWGSRGRVVWTHGVVTPYSEFDADFSVPELPRRALHDRHDLDDLAARIEGNADAMQHGARRPTYDDVELIVEILAGRRHTTYDVNAEAADRAAQADRLTQEQATLLKVTRLLRRVEVRGGAGSGKTVLALQQAKELTRGISAGVSLRQAQDTATGSTNGGSAGVSTGSTNGGSAGVSTSSTNEVSTGSTNEGQGSTDGGSTHAGSIGGRRAERVALVCYSIGLAEYLKREVAGWPRKHQPAFVGTFHEFGRQWGAPDGDRSDSEFWEEQLPALMAELAADLPDGKKYDSVIVDEAQDFADNWWGAVLGSLRDEEAGGLYLYSDENQRIFERFGRPPVPLVPLVLDHNLRNTKQIHDAFGPLAPSRMYAVGGDGASVRFVPVATEDALGVADDQVDALLDEGWRPENVCLLTTGRRHPVQVERTEFHDQAGYWQTFWDDDDVFYGHVLGCKGLERPAVVLCINGQAGDRDRATERLYVGMSRATDLLVVVGDPDVVREVGGEQVAKRLGI